VLQLIVFMALYLVFYFFLREPTYFIRFHPCSPLFAAAEASMGTYYEHPLEYLPPHTCSRPFSKILSHSGIKLINPTVPSPLKEKTLSVEFLTPIESISIYHTFQMKIKPSDSSGRACPNTFVDSRTAFSLGPRSIINA